jgi:hypothetical protein
MPSSKPTNYNKLRTTELDVLLTTRGLPTTGTKLQKAARLFKEDADTSAEQKASTQRAAAAFMPTDRAGYNDLGRSRGMPTIGRQENVRAQSRSIFSGVPEFGVGGFSQSGDEQVKWLSVELAQDERGENADKKKTRGGKKQKETLLKLSTHRGQDEEVEVSRRCVSHGGNSVTSSTHRSIEDTNDACGSAYTAAIKTMKKDQVSGRYTGKVASTKYLSQKVEEIAAWIGDQEWSFVCVAVVVLMGLVLAFLCVQVSRLWKA